MLSGEVKILLRTFNTLSVRNISLCNKRQTLWNGEHPVIKIGNHLGSIDLGFEYNSTI